MRKINKIIIHCSDSDVKQHDDISVIYGWHVNERGFNDVGYHFFIKWDGTIQKGRDLSAIGAHCKGQNSDSIGICLHGRHKFTTKQFYELKALLYELMSQFKLTTKDIYPHNHFDKGKTCPNFDINTI